MAWQPLTPFKTAAGAIVKAGVVVSGTAGAGRRAADIRVTLRSQVFSGPAWLTKGGRCRVFFGSGPQHGMLRVVPDAGGEFAFESYARSGPGVVSLRLPWPPHAAPVRHSPTVAEFDFGDDWLELTLPAWARPPAAPQPGAALQHGAALQPTAAPRRYISPSDRLPDPAAQDRLAAKAAGGEFRG